MSHDDNSLQENKGPDTLLPAESFTTSDITKSVKLRFGEHDTKRFPPVSIYTIFKKTVEQRGDAIALAYKCKTSVIGSPSWSKISFKQYWQICNKAARSFIKLGLGISECVLILGFNSPEWFFSLIGALFAGGIGCGIYTTNSAEACEYVIGDTKSRIAIVENKVQLDKLIKSKHIVDFIKIVQYSGIIENNYDGLVIDWNKFMELGNDVNETELNSRIKTLAPNKCATLIYTSGTTGNPKGVMVSHDSITYTIRYLTADIGNLNFFNERIVSYLPLSHIAGQILDIFTPLYIGASVYFAQPDALKGGLVHTLKDVRPTFFMGVPRVYEKMQEAIEKVIRNLSGMRRDILNWSRKVASRHIKTSFHYYYLLDHTKLNASYKVAMKLVLKKVHKELGLDLCKNFFSGAAPIQKSTLEFFISLGFPLCETYGLSETTGPHSAGTYYLNRVGSIGPIKQLNQSKLFQKEEDGSGELIIFGRHVFMGYLNDDKKTHESIDKEGWFHTGDIAKFESGFIYITGRKKELLITAGGENVAPIPIEDTVKSHLSELISNCMLIGDKRIEFLKAKGSTSLSLDDILEFKDKVVYDAISLAIKKTNETVISNASKIQKFLILPRDFSLANGELTPTLKLKRQMVAKIYETEINKLYEENESV